MRIKIIVRGWGEIEAAKERLEREKGFSDFDFRTLETLAYDHYVFEYEVKGCDVDRKASGYLLKQTTFDCR